MWQYFMGGCCLDRELGDIIHRAGDWDLQKSEIEVQKSPTAEWSIMPRAEGRLVKKA